MNPDEVVDDGLHAEVEVILVEDDRVAFRGESVRISEVLVMDDSGGWIVLGVVALDERHRARRIDPGQAGMVEPMHLEEAFAVARKRQTEKESRGARNHGLTLGQNNSTPFAN
jgi:hypothetical protein